MNHTNHEVEFIKLPEVKKLTGYGTTKLYELVNTGLFPAQVKHGAKSVFWIKSEVLEWNREQVEACRNPRPVRVEERQSA
ncbi:AlpA family phage regulatory protein [Pseudomonas sp. RC10]|uniref:helix-turn-helix transcriptional regulator n=1 Tax=Pseudomonas bambusae TaxID=3139142 RepID=UPI00313A15C1